jgi:hypothetical protein
VSYPCPHCHDAEPRARKDAAEVDMRAPALITPVLTDECNQSRKERLTMGTVHPITRHAGALAYRNGFSQTLANQREELRRVAQNAHDAAERAHRRELDEARVRNEADCCADCGAQLGIRVRLSWDPHTRIIRCLDCAAEAESARRARLEALKPDAEKLSAYAAALVAVEAPALKHRDAKARMLAATRALAALAEGLRGEL